MIDKAEDKVMDKLKEAMINVFMTSSMCGLDVFREGQYVKNVCLGDCSSCSFIVNTLDKYLKAISIPNPNSLESTEHVAKVMLLRTKYRIEDTIYDYTKEAQVLMREVLMVVNRLLLENPSSMISCILDIFR